MSELVQDRDHLAIEAFEAQDAWALIALFAIGQPSFDEADDIVGYIQSLKGVDRGLPVFDIGAGFGRHLHSFANRGRTVSGIDPSSICCRVANRILGHSAVTQRDASSIGSTLSRSLFLIMSDTISLLPTPDESLIDALAGLRSRLPKHSELVVELAGPARWPDESAYDWPAPGDVTISVSTIRDGDQAVRAFRFVRGNENFDLTGVQYLLTSHDLTTALTQAGFVDVTVHELAGGRVSPGSQQICETLLAHCRT